MMNKSLRGQGAESSGKRGYGFRWSFLRMQPRLEAKKQKKQKRAAGDRRL
jgi:hypothetical protein